MAGRIEANPEAGVAALSPRPLACRSPLRWALPPMNTFEIADRDG
jgi:hypothetical protein